MTEETPEEIKASLAKEHDDTLERLHRIALTGSKYKTELDTVASKIFALLEEWLNTRYVGSCSAVSALGDHVRKSAKDGDQLLYSIKLEADQLVIDENVLVQKYREAPKSSREMS